MTAATVTAMDTPSLPRRPPSHSGHEQCPRTTSASTAATAGPPPSALQRCARWRKALAASQQERPPVALIQTGGRCRLLRGHPRQSGSSFTAGGRPTTPSSLPPSLLPTLSLTPPPHISPCLKPPGRGRTASLQRGRKCPRVAHAAPVAAAMLRITRSPTHPIRASQ